MSLVCWYHGSLVAWSNFGSWQPGNGHHVMGPSSTTTMTHVSACRSVLQRFWGLWLWTLQWTTTRCGALFVQRFAKAGSQYWDGGSENTYIHREMQQAHIWRDTNLQCAWNIYTVNTWFQYCCKWWSQLLPLSPSSLPSTRWTQAALVPMPPSEPRVGKPDVFDMHKTGWDPSHWRFHVYLAWAYYTTHYASFWRKMHLAGGTGESFRCKWDGTVH